MSRITTPQELFSQARAALPALVIFLFMHLASQGQSVLEEITIGKGGGWKLVTNDVEADSSIRGQEWIAEGQTKRTRTLLLRMVSFEKTRSQKAMPSDSLYRYLLYSKVARYIGLDTGLVLKDVRINGERKPGLRFCIPSKRTGSKYEPEDLAALVWFVNGKTTFHILSVHTTKGAFDAAFVKKWIAIFQDAQLQPPANSYLAETTFLFGAKGEYRPGDALIADFTNAVVARLKNIYRRLLSEEDIEVRATGNNAPPTLHLTLRGSFNSAAMIEALSRKPQASDFILHKSDTAVSDLRKQLIGLQKNRSGSPVLIFEKSSHNAASRVGEIAMFSQSDSVAVKALLQPIKLPATKAFCFVNQNLDANSNAIVPLYLIDKEPLVNANNLLSCTVQFDAQGYAGVVFTLDAAGRQKLAGHSRQNIGRVIAVAIKGDVVSTPVISSEIPNGLLLLSGGMTVQYAYSLLQKLGHPYPAGFQFLGIKQ